ncbi:hypothetical protein ABPG74_018188 [Tetrahymena malaccensis]
MSNRSSNIQNASENAQKENKNSESEEQKNILSTFYYTMFQEIQNNKTEYPKISEAIENLYKNYKITHNTFFVITKDVTWNASTLFKRLSCSKVKDKSTISDKVRWQQSFTRIVNLTLRIIRLHEEGSSKKVGEFIILHYFDQNQLEQEISQPNYLLKNKKQNHQQDDINSNTSQQKLQKRQSNLLKYDTKFNQKNQQQMNQIQKTDQFVNQTNGSSQRPNNSHEQSLLSQNKNISSLPAQINTKVEQSLDQNHQKKEEPMHQLINYTKLEYVELDDKDKIQLLQKQLEQQLLQKQIIQYKLIQEQKKNARMKEELFFKNNPNFQSNGLDQSNPISIVD